jgi:hypothetical protein
MSPPLFDPSPEPKVFRKILAVIGFVAVLLLPGAAEAQISKGHQILIDRGLQIQGLSVDDNFLTLSTYSNANYTSIQWLNEINTNGVATHSSRPDWMGTPPGFPWSRWAKAENQMAPHVTPYGGDETPHMSQLVALQLGDEWNLDDTTIRNRLVDWFIAVRTNYPNTILYHNSWGTQVADGNLYDFYSRALPDMLCFDTYPWKSVHDTNAPYHIGPPIGGPPTAWYGDLRRYREHARGAGIPLGIYRQTFNSVQDYDQTVYRNPSRPELRLNTFAALAFNVKFISDFVYNLGANSFFEKPCNWCGDSVTNNSGLFAEVTDVNLRARNFGKALVRLTPITNERIAGYTTTMMFIRGKDANGTLNPVPIGFIAGGSDPHSSWLQGHNDPYLVNWAVTNIGIHNNGKPGDVIVSWFKPLDESFDGPDYSNEIYMMVVNGLVQTNGSPTECAQEIKLNFDARVGAVEMLNPLTGIAELQVLPLVNNLRQLTLNLNGGDAAFFKFADGAPFVGTQLAPITGSPVITLHPADSESLVGGQATFTVHALGSNPLNYQWKVNDQDIPGATASSYTRTGIQIAHGGGYTVVVSNAVGNATSIAANLTVYAGFPFLYEPFDYSNVGSPVNSNTPENWTNNVAAQPNDTHVALGSLHYPGLIPSIGNSITNGGAGVGIRRFLGTNIDSGTVYFSALFKMTSMGAWTPANMPALIGGLLTTNNTTARLGVTIRSNTPTTYLFGLQKGGTGATIVSDTTPRSIGETFLLVGKYDFTVSPNTVSLWINPTHSTFSSIASPTSGFITTNSGADGFSIDRFNFRQNTAVSVPAAVQWDELRIGTKWADVTPLAAPVPASLTNVARVSNGIFQFSYTGATNGVGSVYGSTNLVTWDFLGSPAEVTPGTYLFNDPAATNSAHRFYQLRWP